MFSALLDTCVLVPSRARDVLLEIASTGTYRPLWSSEILAELDRTLRLLLGKRGVSPEEADAYLARLSQQMKTTFPDALVTDWESLTETIELPDLDDRHVVAAARAGRADVIVTDNLAHFPAAALPTPLTRQSLDDFLLDALDRSHARAGVLGRAYLGAWPPTGQAGAENGAGHPARRHRLRPARRQYHRDIRRTHRNLNQQEGGRRVSPDSATGEGGTALPGTGTPQREAGPPPAGPGDFAVPAARRYGWRPGPGRPGTGAGRWYRPLAATACVVAVLLLYAAYLGQSRSLGTDADGAGNVLQAWDMLHGNLLLRGWSLSDVSFYTTELPEYMLAELARGLNAAVISSAGAATYTLLLVLAAVLAKGRATGTKGLTRMLVAGGIMLAPGPGFSAASLLSSPDHTGTQVPLLLTWLVIDRLADRWYLPWLVCALLAWVEMADQMAVYVGALPIIIVSAIRLWQRRRSWRIDAGLLAGAAASVPLAEAGLHLIHRAGGFAVAPTTAVFTTSAKLPHNVALTVESVLTLFGADFFGQRAGIGAAAALLHLTGVILAGWACCIAGRRLLTVRGRLVPLLLVGIVINLVTYMLSTQAADLGSTHELAAVLPFAAALAGRLLPGRARMNALRPALLAVLAGYAGLLAFQATRPPTPPTTHAVASWLTAQHLTAGIGDYWTANITTVATSGRVRVRPVRLSCGRFTPDAWESKQSWYEPPSTATFLLLALTSAAGANGTAAQAAAQFGAPQRAARVGVYEVLVWNHNLLPAVTSGLAGGCAGQRPALRPGAGATARAPLPGG